MSINPQMKKTVDSVTTRVKNLLADKKNIDAQIKDLVDSCAEQTGVRAKNIKQLAKDKMMSKEERADKIAAEEQLDSLRVALGLLKDLPLGQAAIEARDQEESEKPAKKAKAKAEKKPKAKAKSVKPKPSKEVEQDEFEAAAPMMTEEEAAYAH
jgi:septal ring factor EnvC (AmiA/AmiB activator)